MVKSLIESYKTLKEAGGASGGFVQAMQKKAAGSGAASAAPKPLGGSSSVGTSSVVPSAAPSQAKIDKSRSLQNTNLKPGTNTTASPVSKTPSVNAAIGGASPTDTQRRAGMSITNTRDAMYGKNPTKKAAAGPTPNTGASGASPVPNAERPRAPAPVPNKGMKGSPLDQTQGARPEVSRDYRLNQMRQKPPALDTKRDASLDSPSERSPMARATNPNVGGAGGGNYKAAQTPSVVSTGNPNAAGGTAPVRPGTPPKPTLKPARTAPQTQTKKPGVVKKQNAPVKLARKPQATGTQNNMTPAQRAQQNRRVERGNARPGEKTIGLGIKTGKNTGKTAKTLKEGAMSNKQLSEMIKNIRLKNKLEEQNPKAEASAYRNKQKFKPEHIPDPYNKGSSPNDYKHRMAEGMQQSTLGPDRSKKMNVYSSTKGALEKRRWGGNQKRKPEDYTAESNETDLGPTETGQSGEKTEKIKVNPKDTTFSTKDSTTKNTTIKERKEK